MSALKLHGIVPPVVTPLTPDYQVDEVSLRKVIRHLIETVYMAYSCSAQHPKWYF